MLLAATFVSCCVITSSVHMRLQGPELVILQEAHVYLLRRRSTGPSKTQNNYLLFDNLLMCTSAPAGNQTIVLSLWIWLCILSMLTECIGAGQQQQFRSNMCQNDICPDLHSPRCSDSACCTPWSNWDPGPVFWSSRGSGYFSRNCTMNNVPGLVQNMRKLCSKYYTTLSRETPRTSVSYSTLKTGSSMVESDM